MYSKALNRKITVNFNGTLLQPCQLGSLTEELLFSSTVVTNHGNFTEAEFTLIK